MELMKCKFQCPQIMLYWNIAIHFHIICDCLQAPGRSWVVVTHGASDVCSPVLSRESLQPLFCSVLGPVLGIGATGLFPLVCVTKTTSWGCLKPQKWIPSEVKVSVGACYFWGLQGSVLSCLFQLLVHLNFLARVPLVPSSKPAGDIFRPLRDSEHSASLSPRLSR